MAVPEQRWRQRWSSLPTPVRDAAPAIPVVCFLVFAALAEDGPPARRAVSLVALSVMVVVLLALRRRRPRGVWATTLVLAVVVPLTTGDDIAWFIQLTVAAYSLVAGDPAARAGVVLGGSIGAAVAGQAALVLVGDQRPDPALFAVPVLALVYPVGLGLAVRANRRHVQELAERAHELERLRRIEAREAVLEERTRIARELHDVVAHHVSGIVLQAKAGRRALSPVDSPVADALEDIASSGASALTSMRTLVGMLREDPATGPPPRPQPTVEQIPDLVARARPGLRTALHVTGTPVRVADDIGLSAYRIVQEALTNTTRHARARRTTVTLSWSEDRLRILVDDDGTGPSGAPEGHGLVGMRERAAMCGGTLQVGSAPSGGFRVDARLPIRAGS